MSFFFHQSPNISLIYLLSINSTCILLYNYSIACFSSVAVLLFCRSADLWLGAVAECMVKMLLLQFTEKMAMGHMFLVFYLLSIDVKLVCLLN